MPPLLLVALLLIVDAEVPSHGRYQDTRLDVISEPLKEELSPLEEITSSDHTVSGGPEPARAHQIWLRNIPHNQITFRSPEQP